MLVLAGAGIGKTGTLTAAVGRRIRDSGTEPDRILAVTAVHPPKVLVRSVNLTFAPQDDLRADLDDPKDRKGAKNPFTFTRRSDPR